MVPPPAVFEARLVQARMLTRSVRELTFERTDGHPMRFEPGQWVNALLPIEVDGTTGIKRSYSIASAPETTPRFEIAFTRVKDGPGSNWLWGLAPGAAVSFVGPQGFFTRPAGDGAASLMIATGTGVTPMRSMMRAAISHGSNTPMWLLFGVRHEEDLVYRTEFEEMAALHEFVRFQPTLSQPGAAWSGRHGYVQAHVRELWSNLSASSGAPPHAYVCGLERMVGSVRDLLRKEMGVSRQQVHTERYD